MNNVRVCPITYQDLAGDQNYSSEGLKLLSRQLKRLEPLALTLEEQREEAQRRAGRMSIQGVQIKLSAKLAIRAGRFEIVDWGGTYILKPAPTGYREVPENEDVTMRLAALVDIEVPVHGLTYAKGGTWTYFIKRFDRRKGRKFYLEDFGQLLKLPREVKYDTSMEAFAGVVREYTTFPALECRKFFLRAIFCFLTGNEDMHAKNFSLFSEDNEVFKLSPAYDLLNGAVATSGKSKEELAVPLHGKKSKLTRKDFLEYFGKEQLRLSASVIAECLEQLQKAFPGWENLIRRSFLSNETKRAYLNLLAERRGRLGL